jgi:phage-related protein
MQNAYQFRFEFLDDLSALKKRLDGTFSDIKRKTDIFNKQSAKPTGGNDIGGQAAGLVGTIGKLGVVSAALGTAWAGISFGRESLDTFQALNENATLLKMKLGEVQAPKAIQELSEFADKMGKPIKDVQDSFVSLVNRGFTPTMEQMRSLSDFAISSKKPIVQFIEALLDAETNEFERLKEFGVKTKQKGDSIEVTYNNVTKTIGNNANAVRDYLLGLGNTDGIKGISEKLGAGIGGVRVRWENSILKMKEKLGSLIEPFVTKVLPIFTEGVNKITEWLTPFADKVGGVISFLEKSFAAVSEFIKPLFEPLQRFFLGLFNVLEKHYQRLINVFKNNGSGFEKIKIVFEKIRDVVAWVNNLLVSILIPAIDLVYRLFAFLLDGAVKMFEKWFDFYNALFTEIEKIFNWLSDIFASVSSSIGDIIEGLFPGFRDAFQNIKDWLYNKFIQPVSGWFSDLFKSRENGSNNFLNNETAKTEQKPKTQGLGVTKSLTGGGGKGESVSGGANIKHINITINKLVETMVFRHETAKQNISDMRNQVLDAVIGTLNDANLSI